MKGRFLLTAILSLVVLMGVGDAGRASSSGRGHDQLDPTPPVRDGTRVVLEQELLYVQEATGAMRSF